MIKAAKKATTGEGGLAKTSLIILRSSLKDILNELNAGK